MRSTTKSTTAGIIILLIAAVLIGVSVTFAMEALRDVRWDDQHYECPTPVVDGN